MVTLLILIILINALFFLLIVIFVINSFLFIGVIIIWLQSSHGLMFSWLPLLLSKAILGLPHSVMIGPEHAVLIFPLVIEDLLLLCLYLLRLELVNHFLLLLSPLRILQVIHVQLVFQVINVGEFLDVDGVESLELSL